MGNFDEQGCGLLNITTTLHPLTQALVDAYTSNGWGIMPISIQQAHNNIVLASIDQAYPAFDTDVAGEYQNDDLKGKRIVVASGGNMPMSIPDQISLDPETGIVTSIYPLQTHVLTIGYYINGLPDLMP